MKKSHLLFLVLGVGMYANSIAAPPKIPVTVDVQGDGVVTSETADITCPSDCTGEYKKFTTVILIATADPNSSFLGWEGACVGTDPICKIKVTAPTVVTAIFDTATVFYPAPVPQTGQTFCVNTTGEVNCSGTGQDGDILAGAALPTPRFTDNSDGTITDNLTGLSWLKDMGCFGNVSWLDSFNLVASFNSGTDMSCTDYVSGTYDNWRVANINELLSLINYGFFLPAISNTQGNARWSEGDPFVNIRVFPEAAIIRSSTPGARDPLETAIWVMEVAYGETFITGSAVHADVFFWVVRGPE